MTLAECMRTRRATPHLLSGRGPSPHVVALGGNALLRGGEPATADAQRRNLAAAADVLVDLSRGAELVVTHGNGPQVGRLAAASREGVGAPLDVLGAQTQGSIGYLIEDELRDRLGPSREVATLLTQVVVEPDDPAFREPTKPIGAVLDRVAADAARERGWSVRRVGDGWRRVVASPEPRRIMEQRSIEILIAAGVVVVCSGGGGIPVVDDGRGGWQGVEAVVDKDLSSALLAVALGADSLLLLTDVDAVYRDFGRPNAMPIRRATPETLRRESFAPGSMGPKVEAACRFVAAGPTAEGRPRTAAIGALDDARAFARGEAGTWIAR